MDDGNTQLQTFQYNAAGNVTQSIDPSWPQDQLTRTLLMASIC